MPFIAGVLQAVRSLIVCFFLLLYLPAASAAGSNLLELWFEYDGHPVKLASEPEVHCFQQPGMQPFSCSVYRSDDGRYWLSRPAPGQYLLRISVNDNRGNPPLQPGDLYRDYPFRVEARTTGPLLISLHRLLTLRQPQSNTTALPGQAGGCDHAPDYSAAILALFPTAQMHFSWQPLGKDAHYQYTLWRVRCSDDMRIEQMFYRQTANASVTEDIPPNGSGEYYQLELRAVSDNQTIGELMLHDGKGGRPEEYRFIVSDPLIDRSWVYYLLGGLLLVFFGWVVVGALRSQPQPPPAESEQRHRPGILRPLMLTVVLLGMGATAYLQRDQLLPWLEQGVPELQQWAQESMERFGHRGKSPTTVAAVPQVEYGHGTKPPVTQGNEWHGVVVSASESPFVGQSRRAEVRLRLTGKGAEVAFLQAGKWQSPTGSTFMRRSSGGGMTLFGHARGKGYSELWSINIPETTGNVWSLSMDRMITRRDQAGAVLSTERRIASGELHASGG